MLEEIVYLKRVAGVCGALSETAAVNRSTEDLLSLHGSVRGANCYGSDSSVVAKGSRGACCE